MNPSTLSGLDLGGATTTKVIINMMAACPQLCGKLQVRKKGNLCGKAHQHFLFKKQSQHFT